MSNVDLSYIHESLRHLAVPISDLTIDPNNARLHPEKNVKGIADSYRRFGQRKPIVVRKNGMIIEAGNGTLAAIKTLGWTHLACVVCDDDDVEAMAYAIADNRTAEMADWDYDVLGKQLFDLVEKDVSIKEVGFSDEDLDQLLSEMDKTAQEIKVEERKANPPPRQGGRKIKNEDKPSDTGSEPATGVKRTPPPNQDHVELKKPEGAVVKQQGINQLILLFDDQQFEAVKGYLHEIKVYHDTTDNSTAVFQAIMEAAIKYRRG